MIGLKNLERRLAESVLARASAGSLRDAGYLSLDELDRLPRGDRTAAFYAAPERAVPGRPAGRRPAAGGEDTSGTAGDDGATSWAPDDRTSLLVNQGRGSAYRPGRFRRRSVLWSAAVAAVALVIVLVTLLVTGGPSWPPSVSTMKAEIATACQNPDVASEPGQVNFACVTGTQQVLWVFALLASSGNPRFADRKTGRVGLEPITPAQGAEVAWSLNLHQPYDPADPVDSLEVAARAINNIIGGASAIGADGTPTVQAGLESVAANCLRYTGSESVSTRPGFPAVCSDPITTPAQQAALVADAYQKWSGGTAQQAQAAAMLFENAGNPGDPGVQAILRNLAQANL